MKRPTWRQIAWIAAGSAAGFGYYYYIGCVSGTCPITSNPYISTGYGGLVGFILSGAFSTGKKPEQGGQN